MTNPELKWLVLAPVAAVVGGVMAAAAPELLVAIAACGALVRIAWAPTWNLTITFSLLFLAPVTVNSGWRGNTLTYVLLALLGTAVLGSIRRVITGEHRGGNVWPLALVGAASLLATILSETSYKQAELGSRPLVILAIVAWHVTAEARSYPGSLNRAVRFLLYASVPIAMLAVYQRATGTWPFLDEFAVAPQYHSYPGQDRSAGIMGHPIIYGAFCAAMVITATAKRPSNWGWFVLANSIGLVLSGSRSAAVATVLALVVLWVFSHKKFSGRGVALFYVMLLTSLLWLVSLPRVFGGFLGEALTRWTNQEAIASAAARTTRIEVGIEKLTTSDRQLFFGYGPGSSSRYFQLSGVSDGFAQTFDNSYLTFWFDYGLLALLAMATLLVIGILNRTGEPAGRILILTFAVLITVFDAYQWPAAVGIVILGLGLLEKTAKPSPVSEDVPENVKVRPQREDLPENRGRGDRSGAIGLHAAYRRDQKSPAPPVS